MYCGLAMGVWKVLICRVALITRGRDAIAEGKGNRPKGEETSTAPQKTPALHARERRMRWQRKPRKVKTQDGDEKVRLAPGTKAK